MERSLMHVQSELGNTMMPRCVNPEGKGVTIPKTVTCRVLSSDMLKTLLNNSKDVDEHFHSQSSNDLSSLLLTGLHACGDLSVTMLRTFLESEEVKAVVSIGCCYNLLSEEEGGENDAFCGFPISKGVKSTGLHLGRSSRDLACQSADRWKDMEKDASLHNFELHAFRASFQVVLSRYFPQTLTESPTIGRQGKALRRQQQNSNINGSLNNVKCCTAQTGLATDGFSSKPDSTGGKVEHVDKCSLFEKFSHSGLHRLNLKQMHNIDFASIWKETEQFSDMIGPYWSLRAAMGPVLETLILLDRLLFLQEGGDSVKAVIVPIFNPSVSPRNVALIASKVTL